LTEKSEAIVVPCKEMPVIPVYKVEDKKIKKMERGGGGGEALGAR
jgi:hypothetical protein